MRQPEIAALTELDHSAQVPSPEHSAPAEVADEDGLAADRKAVAEQTSFTKRFRVGRYSVVASWSKGRLWGAIEGDCLARPFLSVCLLEPPCFEGTFIHIGPKKLRVIIFNLAVWIHVG